MHFRTNFLVILERAGKGRYARALRWLAEQDIAEYISVLHTTWRRKMWDCVCIDLVIDLLLELATMSRVGSATMSRVGSHSFVASLMLQRLLA